MRMRSGFVGGGDRRKGAVGGGRMGEGAREGGAWVGCAGGRFAGCFTGRPFTQEYIATVFQSNMNEGKRGSISGLWIVVVPRMRVLFLLFLEAK